MYLNTNTVFCDNTQNIFEIGHPVKATLLRPVYTKNNNYKDNYISVF